MRSYSDGYAFAWSLLGFFFCFPPFFFEVGSSWDFIVLTSCVALSNLTVIARLLLPLEQAYFSVYGFCAEHFFVHSLKVLQSYEEYPGPCNRHVFFARVGASHGWPALFLLRLPVQLFMLLDGEVDAPPFFPANTGIVEFCLLGIFGRFYSFLDLIRDVHALKHVVCILVGTSFKIPSLYVGLFFPRVGDGVKEDFV